MANQVTPVNFFAGANPDLYAQQLALQQRQALAQKMMEQGLEPMEGGQQPTNPGGFVPRTSPFTALAHSGKLLAGAMMQKNLNEQQSQLAQQQTQAMIQLLRGGGQPQQAPQTPPTAPTGVSDASASASGAPWAAASQVPQPPPQAQPAAQQGQRNPLSITGDPNRDLALMMASQLFGQEYGGALMKNAMPTDLAKQISEAGFAQGSPEAKAAYAHTLNPPINVRPGGTVYTPGQGPQFTAPIGGAQTIWGPNGPQSSVIPGAQEAAARGAGLTAGATEAAKAPFGFENVTLSDGRVVPISKAALAGVSGAPGAVQTPSPQGSPQLAPTPRPALAPGFPAAGGFGQSTASREAAGANERQLAEEASKGRDAANIAVDTNYNLQHVLQSAQGFETGKFAPTIMGARSYLQGLAPNLFPAAEMEKLKDFQELQKYSIRLGFDQARKMGARESTQIVQMSIESNPNPQMVRPAIEAIGHGLMAQNDYVIAKEKARDAWRQQHGGQLSGFNSSWQDNADPRAFLLRYQSPQEQQKLFGTMDDAGKQKLLKNLQALRQQGIL